MRESSSPLIGVIIPTRDRCETLPFAIRSVLDQSTDSLEIIVSDNFSSDRTRDVVGGFKDQRIRYLRTDRRLSMCDHYDFAVAHSRAAYVVIIGDDDALMPGAVEKLSEKIRSRPSKIYKWYPHFYVWPVPGKEARVSTIEIRREDREINLVEMAKFAIRYGTWRYAHLPMVYHSAVSADVLNDLRQQTGRIFHSTQPDVFTAFALPAFSPTAIHLGDSLTVSGHSPKSNAAILAFKDPRPGHQFIAEYGDYQWDPTLFPDVPVKINMIPDAALKAMKLFDGIYNGERFNYNAMWPYMERYWDCEGKLSLIRRRAEISKYHSFNPALYLLYKAIQRLADVRANLMKRTTATAKLERQFRNGELARPKDVFECAHLLGSLLDRDQIPPSLNFGRASSRASVGSS